MSQTGEPFLKRWSRLKTEHREEVSEKPSTAVARTEEAAISPEREKEIEEKAIAELPPVESLDKDSDYTAFMRKGVPEALRLQALRKLWASDPVSAAPDPLDFQNVDFTHLATDEAVQTSYQVGKGFADRVDEVAQDREADAAARKRADAHVEIAPAPAAPEIPAADKRAAEDQAAPDKPAPRSPA